MISLKSLAGFLTRPDLPPLYFKTFIFKDKLYFKLISSLKGTIPIGSLLKNLFRQTTLNQKGHQNVTFLKLNLETRITLYDPCHSKRHA